MTTHEQNLQEARRILARATPEQLRRLIEDIRKHPDNDGQRAA